MSKLNCVAALTIFTVVVLVAVCVPGSAVESQPPAASAADLPPGPMQETARNACTVCHDAGIIVQQRLSKDAWTREVDKMIRWGTVVDPKDRQLLIDYLSASFPPDKAPDPITHVPAEK